MTDRDVRGRRLAPADRRQQIVRSAREVIVRQGLAVTSLRDIARQAGVSMGTITYHFDSIDEIFSAVVVAESTSFYREVIAAADAEPDPWAALTLLIEPLLDDSEDVSAHWQIWSDYWAVVARRPEMAEAYAGRIRNWEACCARIIARGAAAGTFARVDPPQTALKLAAYCDGLGTQRAQRAAGLTAQAAREWMAEFVRLLLTPAPPSRPVPRSLSGERRRSDAAADRRR